MPNYGRTPILQALAPVLVLVTGLSTGSVSGSGTIPVGKFGSGWVLL